MADFCALCGEKLSFFGGKPLVCANESEIFCSACHDVLSQMNNLERGKYLLEHDKGSNPEKMREFISVWEERAKVKQTYEPPTRPCPACGGEMKLEIKDFRIGAHGDTLLGDGYNVDLFACPECGKVEMYTANFAAIKRREAQRAAQEAEKAERLRQEADARHAQSSNRSSRRSGTKPPWER